MTEPRNHHYVPQCYLRHFATKRKSRWYTWVLEPETQKQYETNIRNVCARRDFNKLDSGNGLKNSVEEMYSEFEGQLAKTLQKINISQREMIAEDWANIYRFVTILAVRHPERRRQYTKKLIDEFRRAARVATDATDMMHLLEKKGFLISNNFSRDSFLLLKSEADVV